MAGALIRKTRVAGEVVSTGSEITRDRIRFCRDGVVLERPISAETYERVLRMDEELSREYAEVASPLNPWDSSEERTHFLTQVFLGRI